MTRMLMCTMMQDYMLRDPNQASLLFALKVSMIQIFHPIPLFSRTRPAGAVHESPAAAIFNNMWGGSEDDTTPGCEGRNKISDTIQCTNASTAREAEEAQGGNGVALGNADSSTRVATESAPDDERHGTRAVVGSKKLMEGKLRIASHEEAAREEEQEKNDTMQEPDRFRAHLLSAQKQEEERDRERDHGTIDSSDALRNGTSR